MLEKTSLGRIRSVLYVLYVLKPAKRADFSRIGRFVNFLMRSQAGPLPVRSVEQKLEKCRWYVIGLRERVRKSASCHLESLVIVPTIITRDALTASSPVYLSFALHPQNYFPTSVVGSGLEVIIRVVLGRRNMLSLAGPDSSISHHSHLAIAPDRRAPLGAIE